MFQDRILISILINMRKEFVRIPLKSRGAATGSPDRRPGAEKQIYFPMGIPAESFSRSSSVRASKKASTLPEHMSISGFTEMKVTM